VGIIGGNAGGRREGKVRCLSFVVGLHPQEHRRHVLRMKRRKDPAKLRKPYIHKKMP